MSGIDDFFVPGYFHLLQYETLRNKLASLSRHQDCGIEALKDAFCDGNDIGSEQGKRAKKRRPEGSESQ